MLKKLSLVLAVTLTGVLPADVEAQTISKDTYMCTFQSGVSRLISPDAPEHGWETCARRISVYAEGFTTPELTFGLSAAYDPRTNRFSNQAAGGTSEFIRPGEHLIILNAQLNGRHLAYSLSTNSFRFVNVIDIERKLISPQAYEALKAASGAAQMFMTVEAADFYRDPSLTVKAEIGRGRIFAWRGNTYDRHGRELVKVECLHPIACNGTIGWIPKTSLSEIKMVERTDEAFPRTIEFPTLELVKRCNVATKFIRGAELKAVIGTKASFAALAGAELSASIEAALKTVREDTYDADVKVERTIFTIFKFRAPTWWETKQWYPRKVRVLIVDRVTTGCNSNNPQEHFELRTDDGAYEITEQEDNSDITSSVVYARFVAQSQARTRGRIKIWALSHIASALSAQRD